MLTVSIPSWKLHSPPIPYSPSSKSSLLTLPALGKYAYQLGLSTLTDLPLPSSLLPHLSNNAHVYLQPRLSFFDLDTGVFFGKTWTGNPSTYVNIQEKRGKLGNVSATQGSPQSPLKTTSGDPSDDDEKLISHTQDQRLSISFKNFVLVLARLICSAFIRIHPYQVIPSL